MNRALIAALCAVSLGSIALVAKTQNWGGLSPEFRTNAIHAEAALSACFSEYDFRRVSQACITNAAVPLGEARTTANRELDRSVLADLDLLKLDIEGVQLDWELWDLTRDRAGYKKVGDQINQDLAAGAKQARKIRNEIQAH
jgi:hypothetical protein